MIAIFIYRFYLVYYSFIVTINLLTIILAVTPSTKISCDDSLFSKQFKFKKNKGIELNLTLGFHWFIVSGVDIMQSIIILISSHYIIEFLRKKR
jgi:hypothetical protein